VVRFVIAAGLSTKDMELVLAFKDSRYNIELPLDERWGFRLPEKQQLAEPWPIPVTISSKAITEAPRPRV
jgi:hypothetical protein